MVTTNAKDAHRQAHSPCPARAQGGTWAQLLPRALPGAGGFASLRDYYYYYWVYFYIELPTKCKDLLSGFYLIVAYFCTVYRLTVTFEQLSKYSNIYRAGREGTRGTGTAQAGSVWGASSEPGAQGCSVKVQAWRYRGTGGMYSSPEQCETSATAGMRGSAIPVSAPTAF